VTEPVDRDRWRAIESILDGALDLPAAERSVYLDRACADDENLRAEVESLLAAHARSGNFMEAPATRAPFLHDAYRPGQDIGPYRLERELGRGGLGVVYVALDTRLGRRVALKLLPDLRRTDPEARARFRREARAASSLDHENICTIYEILESEAGDPCIAMALVEGETLKDRIARGPIPRPRPSIWRSRSFAALRMPTRGA
jgi:serine/threonine protein kinase